MLTIARTAATWKLAGATPEPADKQADAYRAVRDVNHYHSSNWSYSKETQAMQLKEVPWADSVSVLKRNYADNALRSAAAIADVT